MKFFIYAHRVYLPDKRVILCEKINRNKPKRTEKNKSNIRSCFYEKIEFRNLFGTLLARREIIR